MENKLSVLEKELGINFNDKKLLQQVFIHRSFLNENNFLKIDDNERLEFLGDAVLELATTEFLYKNYKELREGDMTAIRSSVVNTPSISSVAERLGFERFMLMSKGEHKSDRGRKHILANTFEAFLGALYLDKGYDDVFLFLKKELFSDIDRIIKDKEYKDPKTYFQEKSQEIEKITPKYKVLKEEGPDHNKSFLVGLYLGDEKISEGRGSSKKKAEIDAAKNGLKIKG